jgi:hypothetical protein
VAAAAAVMAAAKMGKAANKQGEEEGLGDLTIVR